MGQMCWLSPKGGNDNKILHLKVQLNQPWRPYTAFPQFSVPDYRIPGGSLGWATYQKLLKAGWTIVPSHQATAELTEIKPFNRLSA